MPKRALRFLAEEVTLTVDIPRRLSTDMAVVMDWEGCKKKEFVTGALEAAVAAYADELEVYYNIGAEARAGHRRLCEATSAQAAKE